MTAKEKEMTINEVSIKIKELEIQRIKIKEKLDDMDHSPMFSLMKTVRHMGPDYLSTQTFKDDVEKARKDSELIYETYIKEIDIVSKIAKLNLLHKLKTQTRIFDALNGNDEKALDEMMNEIFEDMFSSAMDDHK